MRSSKAAKSCATLAAVIRHASAQNNGGTNRMGRPKRKRPEDIDPKDVAAAMDELCTVFRESYRRRKDGESYTEMEVSYDIVAAGMDCPKFASGSHKAAMREAIRAFDAGVPLHIAEQRFRIGLMSAWYRELMAWEKDK
jgi:hypothetical protein